MINNVQRPALSRRKLLTGAAAGGAAVATSMILPRTAAYAETPTQVPGVPTVVDTSHAAPEVARLFGSYFRDKSAADVEATMAHFAKSPCTYIDAILGWPSYTWQSVHDVFAQYMPTWPAGAKSYPTRIIGDSTSAVVFFTNTPGLFGPSELRTIGVVNFQYGKIARWVDYWDGRHYGIANLDAVKLPDDQFPPDFKESTVGETAAPRLKRVVAELAAALRAGDAAHAAALFAPDASLTDLVSHVQVVGPRSIASFLGNAGSQLPFAGPSTAVRHVVGSIAGGGYEWTATGQVPRGVNAIELDPWGKITNLMSFWDGARASDDRLLHIAAAALEH
ncbi:hypothetical protein [Actinoplanes subtropicus]|uniref:hypothetical protein n=1 Tax=Actinoplanes subtropicus TaxID=543632 RepID=UPI0006909786|nr:hypothetical protein [Actinoplanes subtropicus]